MSLKNPPQIDEDTYLFTHYGFHKKTHTPYLQLLQEKTYKNLELTNQRLTLTFDTSSRFCTGWYDLKTSESHPCENNNKVDEKYHECRICRDKTGFNPAFYHTKDISSQQEDRNQQPHILYLAHFTPGLIKVGISWQNRGIARLLEQGARSALILGTFPTANVARQHEAAIARLEGIAETIQARKKLTLLAKPYDTTAAIKELLDTQKTITKEMGLHTDITQPLLLDRIYIAQSTDFRPHTLIDISGQSTVSGKFIGMFGSVLIMEQNDSQFMYSISQKRGYKVTLSFTEQNIEHAPQQIGLF